MKVGRKTGREKERNGREREDCLREDTSLHQVLPVLGVFLFAVVDPNGGNDACRDSDVVAVDVQK